jgi:hypothetical protein
MTILGYFGGNTALYAEKKVLSVQNNNKNNFTKMTKDLVRNKNIRLKENTTMYGINISSHKR